MLSLPIYSAIDYTARHTALVIHSSAGDPFALLLPVDTPLSSTRLCRQDVPSVGFFIAVDIEPSWLIYRPGQNGCVVQNCFRCRYWVLLIHSYYTTLATCIFARYVVVADGGRCTALVDTAVSSRTASIYVYDAG